MRLKFLMRSKVEHVMSFLGALIQQVRPLIQILRVEFDIVEQIKVNVRESL